MESEALCLHSNVRLSCKWWWAIIGIMPALQCWLGPAAGLISKLSIPAHSFGENSEGNLRGFCVWYCAAMRCECEWYYWTLIVWLIMSWGDKTKLPKLAVTLAPHHMRNPPLTVQVFFKAGWKTRQQKAGYEARQQLHVVHWAPSM